jgi:hypothetical protein
MTWNKDSIQYLLARSDVAVERAILRIYERQTLDEQHKGSTKNKNGIGFGAFDAAYFTMRAKDILRGWKLTPYLARQARRRGIAKYWKQLLEVIEEKEKEK